MTLQELKSVVIAKVENKLALEAKKTILFIRVARNGDEKIWTEMVFWHPGAYTLFAYRFGHENMEEGADGSIGPFTMISNHRSDWKNKFSFIDKIENGTKWTILEEKVMEVKNLGSDEFGFYYYPKH